MFLIFLFNVGTPNIQRMSKQYTQTPPREVSIREHQSIGPQSQTSQIINTQSPIAGMKSR